MLLNLSNTAFVLSIEYVFELLMTLEVSEMSKRKKEQPRGDLGAEN